MSNAESTPEVRNLRAKLNGRVTSDKSTKTVTVLVTRTFKHPKYGKYMRENKRYHAHDEKELAKVGDMVEIEATRPLSKLKRWRLIRVVDAAPDRGADIAVVAPQAGGEQ